MALYPATLTAKRDSRLCVKESAFSRNFERSSELATEDTPRGALPDAYSLET